MRARPTERFVAGAVLAGGRSSRMGTDKAAVEVDGRAMADRVLDALRATGAAPVFVIGGSTPGLSAPTVPDRFPGEGPVGGVLVALSDARTRRAEGVFVLGCDLPWIDEPTLTGLLTGADAIDVDVVVATTDRREPLCALWLPSSRPIVDEAFLDGERAMHRVLASCRVEERPVADASRLRNVNTPGDLRRTRG